MAKPFVLIFLFIASCLPAFVTAQHAAHTTSANPKTVSVVEPQPLLAQAYRLQEALSFLGSSLSHEDEKRLKALQHLPANSEVLKQVQEILDPYCLAMVTINPESRVKVDRGPAKAKLVQGGWVSFLVKVTNEAGVTAPLEVHSPNAEPVLHMSTSQPHVKEENKLTEGQVNQHFLELQMYRNRPLLANLSGLKLEYAVLQVYTKDAGLREAEVSFNVGQGSQDIGFRNAIPILFTCLSSVNVTLHIKDADGRPAMASFIITDGVERVIDDSATNLPVIDYRLKDAQFEYRLLDKELRGIYPLPSRRVAAYDEYPDFFFQPQVYRADGEHVQLPAGTYKVVFTRGPEYITQQTKLVVPGNVSAHEASFTLKRWVNMAKLGWYSGDHHVHAAGCSHYESPEEGVKPGDMWRQAMGEDLNVAAVLAWGPSWYHQKTFFNGRDDSVSNSRHVIHNDVEVSGFPSSHAGHIVLLGLREDDYPGTTKIEDWPSWTPPVLSWAKSQHAVTGYAHSGWGLEPSTPTDKLPNDVIPKMNSIGANEYIVSVTQNLVDLYSAGNTPALWELNMWYHTLNCGFTPRLSGETDFPCIFDERVGQARSYFKPEGTLSYNSYLTALKKGRCYVSDGNSHIIDLKVNDKEAGTGDSRLLLRRRQTVTITAKVNARLPEHQSESGKAIAKRAPTEQPYWNIERARIGSTQQVPVELIVNGTPVDTTNIIADGAWKELTFNYEISKSSWIALRVYPSSHSNPVFVIMDGKPIREQKSAEWCRKVVDECWRNKQGGIRADERSTAEEAYNKARKVYDRIIISE